MVMRQRVWIDNHVQGVLVGRVFLYWSGIIIYFVMSIGGYQAWQNPEWTFGEHLSAMIEQLWPCLTTMFLILPLVVFDIVRLSHKFAGPIYRLRNHLDQLNENPQTYPLNFRDDDYWQQLADPINQLQHKLLECEQKLQAMTLVNKGLMTGNLAQLVGNVGNPSATTPEKPTANPATRQVLLQQVLQQQVLQQQVLQQQVQLVLLQQVLQQQVLLQKVLRWFLQVPLQFNQPLTKLQTRQPAILRNRSTAMTLSRYWLHREHHPLKKLRHQQTSWPKMMLPQVQRSRTSRRRWRTCQKSNHS